MAELEKNRSRFQRFTNRLFDPGELTNANIQRNRDMADALLNQASSTAPLQHPLQGVAQLAQALNAQAFRQRSERGESALQEQERQKMAQFLANFDPATAQMIGDAPQSLQGGIAGFAAKQVLTPPEKPDYGTIRTIEGGQNVTRLTVDGIPVPGEQGIVASGPRTSPTTNVNIDTGQNAADKAFGEKIGERAAFRIEQANNTTYEDIQFERMKLALARGAETGKLEETILDVKGVGATLFGLEFGEEEAEAEVIRKIGNEFALRLRNPSSGLGLTGSTSNKDLDFLIASVPGLAKSEAGNLKMIELGLRQNQMKRDVADYQAQLIQANNGSIPRDLDSKIMAFVNNYDFLTDEERAEIDDLTRNPQSLKERFTKTFNPAPPEALDLLRRNPELIDAFEEKYGYRPTGF